MMLTLNHNLTSNTTARHLSNNYSRLASSVERLSSGLRINRAADDAAGLAIRELMRVDIAAMHQGMRNANDAISLLQTADGALAVIDEKLIRMKELAMQAATGTYNSDQRLMIDSEFQAMASEIERIARSTQFNGIKLLDGSLSGEHNGAELAATGRLKVHFGPNNDAAEDYYYLNIGDATLAGLDLRYGAGLTTTEGKEGVLYPPWVDCRERTTRAINSSASRPVLFQWPIFPRAVRTSPLLWTGCPAGKTIFNCSPETDIT